MTASTPAGGKVREADVRSDIFDRVEVPFQGPSNPWFIDPALRRTCTGAPYNRRAVAVIGPHDLSRVSFAVTSNPRQRLWDMQRTSDVPLIVHEAFWSVANRTKLVLAEVAALLEKVNVPIVEGWTTVSRAHIGPLLQLAADRAGVPSQRHSEYHAWVLGEETAKLRARLTKVGVDPKAVAAHFIV